MALLSVRKHKERSENKTFKKSFRNLETDVTGESRAKNSNFFISV